MFNPPAENRAIFHIHIQKTAGLSLRAIFGEIYGYSRVFKLGVMAVGQTNSLEDFMAKEWPGEVRDQHGPVVYLGHFPFGAQERITPRPWVTTCLREPVGRVLSHFEYTRGNSPSQDLDIQAFLDQTDEVNNGMVRRLIGLDTLRGIPWDFMHQAEAEPSRVRVTDDDVTTAVGVLRDHVDVIMIQERMIESLVLLRHVLKTPPLISFSNQFRNRNSDQKYATKYSEQIIEEIRERNRLDIILYEQANTLFENRMRDEALPAHEIFAMGEINATLMACGHANIPFDMAMAKLNALVNATLQAGDPGRAEIILRLLAERLPDHSLLKHTHHAIRARCSQLGCLIG